MVTDNVIIGFGSNLGDSAGILLKAWNILGEHPEVTPGQLSPPFISSPVDMTSNHWFTNAVGSVQTSCSPHGFLELLMETEQVLGRQRDNGKRGYQDRSLDLDLIYFGAAIMDDPRLTLPHPRRAERLFVLAPLVTISPDFVDPESGLSISRLHLDLLEDLKGKRMAQQEISAVSWPDSR
jgi:2-amino-4-hydroxy-6-hydroxymethyldihydropteridine diphosphokinase